MQFIDQAEDYFHKVRFQYEALKAEAKDRRDAGQGELWPVILFYTSSGDAIRIDFVVLDHGSGTLRMQGDDHSGNRCDVVVQAQSAQVVMKILSLAPAERNPVGFHHG